MGRDASMEISFSRSFNKISDLIILFNEIGWNYYNENNKVEYLPIGDDDDFDWQSDTLSEKQLVEIIDKKEEEQELIGIHLFFKNSRYGITLLIKDLGKVLINLNINTIAINNNRNSITDFGWYFDNIVKRINEKVGCLDYYEFEDYVD